MSSIGSATLFAPNALIAQSRSTLFLTELACGLNRGITESHSLALSETRSTTGNQNLDQALIWEMRSLAQFFGIDAGVRILPSNRVNAMATTKSIVSGTEGTILFTTGLLDSELVHRHGGYAIAGVAAHEAAHIYYFLFQDQVEVMRLNRASNTARESELYADVMAAFYLGSTKPNTQWFQTFRRSIGDKGDFAVDDKNHHGTPSERRSAVDFGYSMADTTSSVRHASSKAVDYVLSI